MIETLEAPAQAWLEGLDCIVLVLIVAGLLWDRRRLVTRMQHHIDTRIADQQHATETATEAAVKTAVALERISAVMETLRRR